MNMIHKVDIKLCAYLCKYAHVTCYSNYFF